MAANVAHSNPAQMDLSKLDNIVGALAIEPQAGDQPGGAEPTAEQLEVQDPIAALTAYDPSAKRKSCGNGDAQANKKKLV